MKPSIKAAAAASPSAASAASLFPEEVSEPAPKSTSKYFPCPYEQIVRMYHEKLPMLPSIQTLTTQRKAAIKAKIPYMTTMAAARASAKGIRYVQQHGNGEVKSLQEIHKAIKVKE